MKTGLAAVGTMGVAALAHLPCCGLNVALAAGGLGSGLGFLHVLEPYRPLLIGFSLIMAGVTLAAAFRPHKKCAHSDCHHNERRTLAWRRGAALAATALAVGSIFITPSVDHNHDHSHADHSVPHR